jgi:hypothetical protein
MTAVNPIYASTTILSRIKNDKIIGSATGFFYADKNNRIFLVTNKHVIYGNKYAENPEPEVDRFDLNLHVDANNLSKNKIFKMDLFDKSGKKIWLEHTDPRVDVILIPIEIDRKEYVLFPVSEDCLDCEGVVVNFERIFVMGYPYAWYDKQNNLPIARVGHLSSPLDIDFNGQRYMIGDVETHPGMSGGPVFMWLDDYVKGNTRYMQTKVILVGIHSGQPLWELVDNSGKKEQIKHTLIVIWSYKLIKEILLQLPSS